MAQSLSQVYIHLVFHVKTTSSTINPRHEAQLYAYIIGIIRKQNCYPLIVNGTPDHIHILCSLSTTISLSNLVKQIKQYSSYWLKSLDKCYEGFSWQAGYGGFSVGTNALQNLFSYIGKQKEHHQACSFRDEYLSLLKEYNIQYNEEYLWSD